ncbi:hypothetical protein GCM10009836_69000 [Pseudonocardia ailaonensis]|uniref:Uncharacterized protein n=1 Tax=Pseudonocardia ailaonensis TaxID=367279 RepID=A0ABN2NSP7_9PSEU
MSGVNDGRKAYRLAHPDGGRADTGDLETSGTDRGRLMKRAAAGDRSAKDALASNPRPDPTPTAEDTSTRPARRPTITDGRRLFRSTRQRPTSTNSTESADLPDDAA